MFKNRKGSRNNSKTVKVLALQVTDLRLIPGLPNGLQSTAKSNFCSGRRVAPEYLPCVLPKQTKLKIKHKRINISVTFINISVLMYYKFNKGMSFRSESLTFLAIKCDSIELIFLKVYFIIQTMIIFIQLIFSWVESNYYNIYL